jgi:AcrR family transcriptional regulator
VGDLIDRRARKKAATRALILTTARGLFAERGFERVTIADIAAAADVAVQTVFNHFATKEELFFADRSPWVEGAAASVRSRPPGVPAMAVLHSGLLAQVESYIAGLAEPELRRMALVLSESPQLQAYECDLVEQMRIRLHRALEEAWSDPAAPDRPDDVPLTAGLTAALWVAAARTVVEAARATLPAPEEATARGRTAVELLQRLIGPLDVALGTRSSPALRSEPA